MKAKVIASIVAAAIVAMLASGFASAGTAAVSVAANVTNVWEVSLTNNAVSFSPTASDLENGNYVPGSASPSLLVKSNKAFSLTQTASDFTAPGGLSFPVSRMRYTTTSSKDGVKSGDFSAGTTVLYPAHSRGASTITNNYELSLDLNIEPGVYTTTVTYEAVQN